MRISDWSSDGCSSDLELSHRVSRLDVAVREGGNGGRIRARPTACLPPHQGEGRGGGGLPVSRIVVEPVRTETHPHPTLPLKGRASMRLRSGSLSRSEEHTSELQSLMRISYAVFCLK